ncbi:MAG: Ig-like domain-containing protein [Blautia sp.]|uniref:Ig-like domain-containing protein n=1 Tax=Blautia TaxID=572511 RepID=UPI0025873F08|nr:Ig-like domain-containing protein [Blautia sp.]MCI7288493.1 Ig-like domain-containing protein [Blautia sp.]MDD7453619.1 Ig-like domain-containing protein [Blautia obeum]
MRKERILAVIMSVLLALSMIPATVFAAEIPALDGKLKIQGTAAEGRTLSAEFKEVKPEGVTEDDVAYLWERKTVEDEETEKAGEKPELKELGKDKTYTVTQDDIGSKIVLTVTGKEENGYTGSLKVVSDTVIDAQTAADQEAKAAEEKAAAADTAEQQAAQETENEQSQNTDASADTEETTQTGVSEDTDTTYQEDSTQAGTENIEGIPAATTDEEKQQSESAGSESVDGIPEATEDGTYGQTNDAADTADSQENNDTGKTETPTADASIVIGDGNSEVVDFGTVISGQEDSIQAQYVTVTNTGNTTLNFTDISPEHFMVQDISDPMEQNSSQQLWIVPRAGIAAGEYDDTITYTSEEGVEVSFEAKMTVEAAKDDAQNGNGQDDQKTDTGNTSDPTADDQNKGDETPADSTTDPSNDANTSDGGNNGNTTTEVTLAVDDTVAESGLTFKSTESQQITVKNNSAQAVTVAASSTGAAPAVTIDPSEQEIPAGESATFTVTPAENLVTDTPYPDNILFADKNNSDNKIIVPVNVMIPAPAVRTVTRDPKDGPDFGTLVDGYTELPAPQTITLTNEGNADAVLSDAVSSTGAAQGQYFDITWQAQTVKSGDKAIFTIQPKINLTANATPYTETFTITDTTNGKSIPITATVTVNPSDPSLDVSESMLDFTTAKQGYGEIAPREFMVTNNGNVTETLEQPALTNFTVSVNQLTLAPGSTAVYTVQPKTGLDVGAYSENLKISSSLDKSVTVNFQVVKGNAVLTKIQQPAAVTGLANGTKKDASSLNLPSTVVVETTEGSMKAAVSWNVKGASYKQSSTDAQKFTVAGTVTLPSGVDNDNKISLATSVEVSVNAYSAKVASAENNKITGIDANGVYTTQTKISFTAVGAGMDNNSPKKGDTRYVPQSWTVIITNVWNAAPYTASFGLAQSGDYTLKVAFAQQQYDGSSWKATGTMDTRQVSFSIAKAKVTAPGTNLTPAANRKSSVKTGDNTPILPFVCILIIAAGAIGGVVFYKKKNKK